MIVYDFDQAQTLLTEQLNLNLINTKQSPDNLSARFEGISIDSRKVQPGNAYVAIRGENHNGHAFIAQAVEAGASLVIASEAHNVDVPTLYVNDTVNALGILAKAWLKHCDVPVLAITGSHGKTSTREILTQICQAHFGAEFVLHPERNYNNAIGVPLTLFRLKPSHQVAVIEMGMSGFGEIDSLSQMCEPLAATVTNVNPVHVKELGSVDNIAKAKGEIFRWIQPHGSAVINADDNYADYWRSLIQCDTLITVGMDDKSRSYDISACDYSPSTSRFTLLIQGEEYPVHLQLQGEHSVRNALAAAALATACDIPAPTIVKGIETTQPFTGRLSVHRHASGALLIDDTYNAAPASVHAAADCLANYSGKRIFVLGDMKDLGPDEIVLHQQTGKYLKAKGIEQLLTLGELAAHAAMSFGDNAKTFDSHEAIASFLGDTLDSHTVILAKGSRSMQMEKILKPFL